VEGNWCILWAVTDREKERGAAGEKALAVGTAASAAAAEQRAAVVLMIRGCGLLRCVHALRAAAILLLLQLPADAALLLLLQHCRAAESAEEHKLIRI
jgi:hypothetical protein